MSDPMSNHYLITAMLVLLSVALLGDIRQRRIPNRLVMIGLLFGLAGHGALSGAGGLLFAAAGALVGLLCLLPFYSAGALAAGDVKLMAMCGAFIGPLYAVIASVASLVAGGLLGVAWAFWQLSAGSSEGGADRSGRLASIRALGKHASKSHFVPYALAIGAGVLVTLEFGPTFVNGSYQGVFWW